MSSRLSPSAQRPLNTSSHRRISRALLRWYKQHQRSLPWRQQGDAYAVWVSEIMLQQTQVKTALPYYARWIERLPTVKALATATEDEVLTLWQGLGYYSRARSLRRAAQIVVSDHGGQLPRSVTELRALPGIGPYTAGAIASIAFGQDEPLVDGNVIRVITRVFALSGDPTRKPLKETLWQTAASLIMPGQAGDLNQSLMELGALICTPKSPSCHSCPIRSLCQAFSTSSQESFPETKKRPAITQVEHAAVALLRRGKVLVRKLPADAPRWASMWQLPTVEHEKDESSEAAASRCLKHFAGCQNSLKETTTVEHFVTRYRIRLTLFRSFGPVGPIDLNKSAKLKWLSLDDVAELALPAAQRRLVNHLRGQV